MEKAKKVISGIFEGDALAVKLKNGRTVRTFAELAMFSSEGNVLAIKTDAGVIEIDQIVGMQVSPIKWTTLEEREAELNTTEKEA